MTLDAVVVTADEVTTRAGAVLAAGAVRDRCVAVAEELAAQPGLTAAVAALVAAAR